MRYHYGDVEVDDESFELKKGGIVLVVEPLVLDVIIYLIQHRKRLVKKEELLATVWGGRHVGESALARCISLARKQLGDPSPIRTVHGRGYRWVGIEGPNDGTGASLAQGSLS